MRSKIISEPECEAQCNVKQSTEIKGQQPKERHYKSKHELDIKTSAIVHNDIILGQSNHN